MCVLEGIRTCVCWGGISTVYMRQYNVIVPFYEMKRKRNDLFHCTKHPTHLDEMDGQF